MWNTINGQGGFDGNEDKQKEKKTEEKKSMKREKEKERNERQVEEVMMWKRNDLEEEQKV